MIFFVQIHSRGGLAGVVCAGAIKPTEKKSRDNGAFMGGDGRVFGEFFVIFGVYWL
jgi:hypothetical protein